MYPQWIIDNPSDSGSYNFISVTSINVPNICKEWHMVYVHCFPVLCIVLDAINSRNNHVNYSTMLLPCEVMLTLTRVGVTKVQFRLLISPLREIMTQQISAAMTPFTTAVHLKPMWKSPCINILLYWQLRWRVHHKSMSQLSILSRRLLCMFTVFMLNKHFLSLSLSNINVISY